MVKLFWKGKGLTVKLFWKGKGLMFRLSGNLLNPPGAPKTRGYAIESPQASRPHAYNPISVTIYLPIFEGIWKFF